MTKKLTKALVILSGGADSTTCLFWAIKQFDEVYAITFDYGQRHSIEIESAKKVAQLAGVLGHELINVPNCLVSASPLTSENDLEQYTSYDEMEAIIGDRRELTFVPMRNALFLTIAANRAEALGIKSIITGVCAMDNANYSDCRRVFISATEKYINTALGYDDNWDNKIVIHTPLIHLSKAESIKLCIELDNGAYEALAWTHTSYDGKYPPTDNNHANVLRAQGFIDAGVPDPLVVRAFTENRMDLPDTPNYAGIVEEFSKTEDW